jgi:hypothetical protein
MRSVTGKNNNQYEVIKGSEIEPVADSRPSPKPKDIETTKSANIPIVFIHIIMFVFLH